METSLTGLPKFKVPTWCFNGHVHTITRSLLSHPSKPACQRLTIDTPDDDFLELDVMDADNDRPVVALFHGLEGSSDRYYIVELMQALAAMNWSAVAVNFRSCGARMNRRRRFYHSGETRDFATVFRWIQNHFPGSPLGAVGFSLGGNALVKLLGERGPDHPADAAVAVSVPYNLERGSRMINQGFNKVYQSRFLKSLKAKLIKKRRRYPNLPTFSGHTLYDFDDQVTAPIHGFKDAHDYYSRCSSGQFVESIGIPTLLIHSKEDPLCAMEDMPLKAIKKNRYVDYMITNTGGHVGYRSSPRGWLNEVVMNYMIEKLID